MDNFVVGLIGFIGLLGIIILGVPIAFAAGFVGIIGLFAIGGVNVTFHFLGSSPYSEIANYAYTTLPLYILLGEFAYHGGYAEGAYRTVRQWLSGLPGGLAIATILGGAAFGAVSGASVASAAVLGKICIPEMRKLGYDQSLAAGTVASCANLSSMIPPSGLMIVYSIFTEQSLSKLFISGILPGVLIALLFSAMIYIRVLLNPKLAPPMDEPVSWQSRFASLRYAWQVLLIAAVILGGIYTGTFTVTEAGGAGALTAFLLMGRKISWNNLKVILLSALRTTIMVLFIIVGIMFFTYFLTLSRVPIVVSEFLTGLPISPLLILSSIIIFYLFLGMFFDAISMIALTIPVLFPTVVALGYNPIWFGVICVLMCEVGLLTPPVGINCFVVAGVAPDIPLNQIFKGVIPFIFMDLIAVVILIAFPEIALFLPSLMGP